MDFKQSGAATAKDPSLVASLVCRLSGPQQFPSRHCRTYRTLLALRSRTLRYQSGGALRALAMYRKSTGRRDRFPSTLGPSRCRNWDRAQNAVLRLPVRRHGWLFCGQHLRELVRGIAEQGSDHHRDNKQDQRIGERGRDQVLQWVAGAADGWCREYATSAA